MNINLSQIEIRIKMKNQLIGILFIVLLGNIAVISINRISHFNFMILYILQWEAYSCATDERTTVPGGSQIKAPLKSEPNASSRLSMVPLTRDPK